ncbi:cation:proton antiporter [uncultured Phocaeicola sp.]|uniref:cation:proton antiporter n=2 Tax=uncultured Phocaeicola sp. TaxID=990718 RepID=UPI001433790E|nr:cation:proton antiporter [uncultured Phocaeicola sp.]GFH98975.1 Na(+)/H(+)-K(+) antiporter GerN [Bacteroidaceae bacterium]
MELFDLNIHFPVTDPTWIFFLVLIIILFAPMILGCLRIPHIIGMILAGVAVGKYGFNILERDSSFELFGKVGLYYIMFLAGLEMDMDDFKKNRTKGLVFGMFTFLIPMGLGIWSSMSMLGYGFLTSVLLASMYASHTLIAYPIISRYGLSRQRTVSITIGGTAVTVVLALMVLAVIGGMYKGEEVGGLFWVLLVARVVLLFGLIIFLMPRISRWFFRTYDDAVMQFVFVLAMVFLGGGLMELVGMEGILGAFLAGLVLNRFVPHVSPLMNRLEFVGNALFIPYFLIGVGMIIDVRCLFTEGEALKVAVVMTVVATFSKWLAAWITQKIYGMNKVEGSLIFGLSNAQAAATLAAVLIGHGIIMENGERLLSDDVLNGTVVMILFTCIISSVVTERAARKMVTQENLTEGGEGKELERILIPVANPETIEGLVGMALMMRHPRQKESLVALSVINDNNTSETKELIGKRNLERTAMIAAAADASVKTVLRYDLNIAQGIIHTQKEYAVTDVVIGLHRKTNLMDSFFGNLTESLLKGTNRQIMITKLLMPVNTLRRIVVAVPDKAEYEMGFLKWVTQLCRMGKQLGCRVHFFATEDTLKHLRVVTEKQEANTFTEISVLEEWDDLLLLTGQVSYDHLFVVVSSRKGSISYQTSFERLPAQISKYFANNSLLIVYPDQLGDDPQEIVSFSDPRGQSETRVYDNVGKWFYKWFKKGDERN